MSLETITALSTVREWVDQNEIDSPPLKQLLDNMIQYYEALLDEMANDYDKNEKCDVCHKSTEQLGVWSNDHCGDEYLCESCYKERLEIQAELERDVD